MKKIVAVDENDNEIGLRDRNEDGDFICRVSALWLTNSKGEVLMARRALTKKWGAGKWATAAAGTVEEGETYDSNIVKEIYEELGVTLGLENLTRGSKLFVRGSHDYFLQWYFATLDKAINEFTVPPEEVAAIRWIAPKELHREFATHPEHFTKGALQCLPVSLTE